MPSLYPEETTEEDYFNYVLLGLALGWVRQEENEDGTTVLLYAKRNEKGRPLGKLIDLASLDPSEAGSNLAPASFEIMKSEINSELKQFYCKPDKATFLKKTFSEMLDEEFEKCKGKATDPRYQKFHRAVNAIEGMINDLS